MTVIDEVILMTSVKTVYLHPSISNMFPVRQNTKFVGIKGTQVGINVNVNEVLHILYKNIQYKLIARR